MEIDAHGLPGTHAAAAGAQLDIAQHCAFSPITRIPSASRIGVVTQVCPLPQPSPPPGVQAVTSTHADGRQHWFPPPPATQRVGSAVA